MTKFHRIYATWADLMTFCNLFHRSLHKSFSKYETWSILIRITNFNSSQSIFQSFHKFNLTWWKIYFFGRLSRTCIYFLELKARQLNAVKVLFSADLLTQKLDATRLWLVGISCIFLFTFLLYLKRLKSRASHQLLTFINFDNR